MGYEQYSIDTIEKGASLHGNRFRKRTGSKEHAIDCISPSGITYRERDGRAVNYVAYSAFLERFVWADDGSPCGAENETEGTGNA